MALKEGATEKRQQKLEAEGKVAERMSQQEKQ